jgi:Ca2+-binding RTX toxin-like protein
MESLEDRSMLSVTAMFSAANGTLSVFGDSSDNTIEISRNDGGTLLVNGGSVAITGGAATVANTTLIQVFGMSGNDTISLNEANGALPSSHLYGGSGDDTLIGGSGADRLFGQGGVDELFGKGGSDFHFGGSGGDELTGGDADDFSFGQNGNDKLIWNPGDDTDLNEGGAGIDTVEVNGSDGAEAFTTTANGTRVRFDRLDPAPFSLDIGTAENLLLSAKGGNDSFSATGNLAALISITVDGGAGDDTLLGSNGIDVLIGGDDNDFIDGQQGNDVAFLGDGDDTFQWDPGDGSDTVEGQDGFDTMLFNGSAGSEILEASANGQRVRFTRNLGNIVMDLNDLESIDVNALGGTDTIVVNDLTATDVVELNFNLAASGGVGDAAIDNIIVNATNNDDAILVNGNASGVTVLGLPWQINITGAESSNDRLTVNLLDGDDALDASGLAVTGIQLTAAGGDDDDVLTGGDGSDTLLGDEGDDVLIGGLGIDILDGGPGDNVIIQ